jgi:uncharacterized LabA/DUF88 family protein
MTLDRTAVFLDGGYLSKLTKEVFKCPDGRPRKIDFASLAHSLAKERGAELLRCYYYHCPPYQSQYPTDDEKQRQRSYDQFTYNLRKVRQLQLREGRLRRIYDAEGKPDFIQKGVDVLLAIDMVKLAMKGAIQKVILVACDSDFIPAIRALKEEGVMTHIYYYPDKDVGFSQDLVYECDDRHELTDKYFDECDISPAATPLHKK